MYWLVTWQRQFWPFIVGFHRYSHDRNFLESACSDVFFNEGSRVWGQILLFKFDGNFVMVLDCAIWWSVTELQFGIFIFRFWVIGKHRYWSRPLRKDRDICSQHLSNCRVNHSLLTYDTNIKSLVTVCRCDSVRQWPGGRRAHACRGP